MKFILEISLGNDAMMDTAHLAKALEEVAAAFNANDVTDADKLDAYDRRGVVRDENGNTVGKWEIVFDGRGYLLSKDAPAEQPKVIYRNVNFTERNYECTNLVACEVVDEGAKVPEGYELGDDAFQTYARNLTSLWIEGGIRYLGYL